MSKADDGLRALFTKNLPGDVWECTPIETGGTVSGVPDTFWKCKDPQASGWTEHKATTGWAVGVRPHQIGWIGRHVAAGVRVTVAVRARGIGSAAGHGDSLWLLRGECINHLAQYGLRDLPEAWILGRWYGGPRSWDWGVVARALVA